MKITEISVLVVGITIFATVQGPIVCNNNSNTTCLNGTCGDNNTCNCTDNCTSLCNNNSNTTCLNGTCGDNNTCNCTDNCTSLCNNNNNNNNTTCLNGTCGDNNTCNCTDNYFGDTCNTFLDLMPVETELIPIKGNDETLTVTVTVMSESNDSEVTVMVLSPDTPSFSNTTSTDGKVYSSTTRNVTCSNIGLYIFKATINGVADAEVNATVHIPHVFTIAAMANNSNVSVTSGNDASLSVIVTKGSCGTFENISVIVERPNKENTCNATMTNTSENQKTYTCNIDGAGMNDNGEYRFIVTETNGDKNYTITAAVNLNVEAPPAEPVIMGNTTVLREKGAIIKCLSDGSPKPTITWSYNGIPVLNNITMHVHQLDGNLVFLPTVPFNVNGTYTCIANNTFTAGQMHMTTETTDITIEGSPELQGTPDQPLQTEKVTLSCTAEAFPEATITWSEDDTSSVIFDKSQTLRPEFYKASSTLQIQHSALCLGKKTITCTATNSRGNDTKTFMINQDPYGVYEKDYYIFIGHTDAMQASMDCTQRNGTISVATDNQTSIRAVADSVMVTKYADEESNCYEKNDNVWNMQANCAGSLQYVCRIKATKTPENLHLSPDSCDGSKLNVNWTADNFFSQNISVVHSGVTESYQNLAKSDSMKSFENLRFGKAYTVRVSTGYSICEHHAFAQDTYTSAYENAEIPGNLSMNLTSNGCKITWEYPSGRRAELTGFKVQVIERIRVGNNPPRNVLDMNLTSDSYSVQTTANSVYQVTIKALSCIGDSAEVNQTGCETPAASVSNPSIPTVNVSTAEISTGIRMEIPMFSERNGKVSCVLIVGQWRTGSNTFPNNVQFTEEIFNTIKNSDDVVNEPESYFVYAGSNTGTSITIGLGERITSCIKPIRRKREISSLEPYRAKNRNLVGNSRYRFYIVVVTQANSGNFLLASSAWTNEIVVTVVNPEVFPVVAVVVPIVLILLLILIVILLLYCRRRQKKNKETPRTLQRNQ